MDSKNVYPNARKPYSDEEIEFITQSKDMYTVKEYAEILGRSPQALRQKIISLGIQPKKRPLYSEDGTKKYCNGCKMFLPLDSFNERFRRGKKTLRSLCKVCEYNYNLDYKLARKGMKPKAKPTFQEVLLTSKKDEYFCNVCKTKLTEDNSFVVWSSRKNTYIISYRCRECVNKNSRIHKHKLLLERGY